MQPSTGRAVGGQPPSERGACLLVKSTYQCRGYESSWAVVAHRVIRRRALLPCCSQRTLTRDIPETSLSIRSKGNVLNKSKPRGSPLKLSLVSRVVFFVLQGGQSPRCRRFPAPQTMWSGAATFWKPMVASGKTTSTRISYVDLLRSRVLSRCALRVPGPTQDEQKLACRCASTR